MTTTSRTTRRFGCSATLSRFDNARLGGRINPDILAIVKDRVYRMAVETIETYTTEVANGEVCRLVEPRIICTVEPKGLYIDLKGDLIEGNAGMLWLTTSFNYLLFRERLSQLIDAAGRNWAEENYKKHFRADQNGLQLLDSRPTD